ncbi:Hsp20/alpha crystallin family protein [Geomesophilobacter sediminis]|uniref:Hsp20/alpha crystallin family protein n=1 Tax=Geomesophilobacter sediminis TaxID=2798584 RepID=A0A8J7SBA7_9BACT|nr:Hsp20/alpha crystallin family protein [Geomesophilobacter sediminis]MBJ6727701.1 Hsp20/alpha crystallin family protein [Geomesophilobacter sediminis]
MASWSLFNELESLRREIDEAFRGVGFARPLATTFLSPTSARRFPLINLSEDEGQVYLEALVPGVDPNQLDVSLLRDTVTIAGERKAPGERQGELVHRKELGFGKFSRTIDLPTEIDPSRTSADFRDGVLRISMAKPEHAQPKKIEVKIS